jgi:hypothetical protein
MASPNVKTSRAGRSLQTQPLKKYCAKSADKELSRMALVQGSVPEHFMMEPFNLFFQMRLATPEFGKHLAVVIWAMEQCLVDLIFEPFKISNEGWLCHNSLQLHV